MTPEQKLKATIARLRALLKERMATIVEAERRNRAHRYEIYELKAKIAELERTIELLKQSGPPLARKSVNEIANRMVAAMRAPS